MMSCWPLFSRKRRNIKMRNKEIQRFSTSAATINYRAVSPYAHAIRNDVVQVESSDVVDTNTNDTFLFNGTMPDRTTRSLSFDDENKSPAALARKNDDGHCLSERLVSIAHVSAANNSKNSSMSPAKSFKPSSSNAVPKARPFDEFASDLTTSNNPFDGQDFSTTKSDKD